MKNLYFLIAICLLVIAGKSYAQDYAFDTLDINNIRAVFNSTGINFSQDYNSFFEVPKGSNNRTIGCNTLWISGKDVHSSTFLAGGTGTSAGKDYYPGPLTTDGTAQTDSVTMTQWNKVWKVNRNEIQYHISHWHLPGYVIPYDILHWPAHGDTLKHQDYHMAPFVDRDGNGKYDPSQGDYPLIRGDKALFFIFNDKGGPHLATGGTSGGLEIHAMAYAFHCPDDSALSNTLFINYKIINRSSEAYNSVLMGVYSDIDIGNAQDDFTGSDIIRSSFYTYSASNSNPLPGNIFPAQATTILGGPFLYPDGEDNPAYDSLIPSTCNDAINGLNFGDGLEDNERYGMTCFMSFNKSGNPLFCDPATCNDYLKFMQTKWKDGRRLQYGGFGYDYTAPFGPDCKFMYPGLSDPCNWGTFGYPPNGPVNWTEETAGNIPGDRQGLALMGPSMVEAGEQLELDVAFIFAADYSHPGQTDAWHEVLNQRIDSIRSYFKKDMIPCGESISGIARVTKSSDTGLINVYPNPSSNRLYINVAENGNDNYGCRIYNMQGTECLSVNLISDSGEGIDISRLTEGIYQLVISHENRLYSSKFLKINP